MIRRSASTSNRRSGYTLVEILATLGVLMVMGLAAAKLLGSVTDIGLRTSKNKQARVTAERFAQQLRKDIAVANQATVSDDGASIDVQTDSHDVHYVVLAPNHCIDRVAKKDGKQVSQERYALTDRCTPVFSTDQKLVRLQLMPESQLTQWTIEAVMP